MGKTTWENNVYREKQPIIIFSFIRDFSLLMILCFLGNISCKPFSVSKKTAQEELENIFLV